MIVFRQVTSNGVEVGKFESSADTVSGYTAFALRDEGVETLTLTTSGLGPTEWISILEVSVEHCRRVRYSKSSTLWPKYFLADRQAP